MSGEEAEGCAFFCMMGEKMKKKSPEKPREDGSVTQESFNSNFPMQ